MRREMENVWVMWVQPSSRSVSIYRLAARGQASTRY